MTIALPAAPIDARDFLRATCATLNLELNAGQLDTLLGYLGLLQRWNKIYNLTAVRSTDGMLIQHLADCLAVVGPLAAQHPSPGRLIDVGSGGGLPGLVIATCLPLWDVTCIDAVAKKMAFVRQAGAELGLRNLHALHGRIETVTSPFDVVCSRAFASLDEFVALSRTALAPAGCWMAMKGKRPDEEIAALPANIEVFHVEPLRVPGLDAERCLVWMRQRRNPVTEATERPERC